MEIRILLVCRPGRASEMYQKHLQPLGVVFDVVASFVEYFRKSPDKKYNGILFDLSTLIKMGQNDKALAHDFISVFPTLRIRWDEQEGGSAPSTSEPSSIRSLPSIFLFPAAVPRSSPGPSGTAGASCGT